MIKYKKILILVIILFGVLACNAHYFVKYPDESVTVPVTLKKNVKIAYVGFVPFRSYVSGVSGRTTTYTAVLDKTKRLPLSETVAQPAHALKSNGLRKDVPKEKVLKFVSDYLSIVKKSGTEELIHVIEPVKDGKKTEDGKDSYTPYLRNLDADYIVVGALSPAFEDMSFAVTFPHLFSTLFSIVTLGIFPSFQWGNAAIDVKVYDKNLNQVWQKEYDASYTVLRALWVSSYPKECSERLSCIVKQREAVPGFVYRDLLPQVEFDVSNFVSSN
ncbi:hypothetical protein EHQ81_19020 [Leptospira selangorensis]|uniref:Lipoprotein n=1 Tax=Leptospira selangorensis TaxID=2484982 RepID=A0A4R9G1H7_9LEPT|nr:hypothetical protein [Leptospira selangorensis]TGK04650.1 hypothetical protein EHO58_12210 [Leptospira selangorensis]TGM10605.1 hypothetical protein EHQ81_19020 [Leptospira selangorensis]TGM26074.1 hypothetical protein EHQ82_04650 [Leptospira selangorensis]